MIDGIKKDENAEGLKRFTLRLPMAVVARIDSEARAETIQPGQVARRIIVRHYQQTAGGKPVETF